MMRRRTKHSLLSVVIATACTSACAHASSLSTTMGSVEIVMPSRLLSRSRPVTSSEGASSSLGTVTSVNDGHYYAHDGFGASVGAAMPWIAIDVGAGPTRVMVTWLAEGSTDAPTAIPVDYRLEVSQDGLVWTRVKTVTGNRFNARADVIAFDGQSRVRIVVERADTSARVHLIEMEVYDVSNGTQDTFMFLGDSITAGAMSHYVTPDLATLIHEARPAWTPMIIDLAVGGTDTEYALTPDERGTSPLDRWIESFPDVHNVVVAYGTNDSVCDQTGADEPAYRARLREIVTRLQHTGKRVIIPHIPWNHWPDCEPTNLAPYNLAIDELRALLGFMAGPDLHAYFAAHREELPDGVHPNDAGVAAMNILWRDALLPLYPP